MPMRVRYSQTVEMRVDLAPLKALDLVTEKALDLVTERALQRAYLLVQAVSVYYKK